MHMHATKIEWESMTHEFASDIDYDPIFFVLQASVSLKRLQNFLKNEELDEKNVEKTTSGGT